MRLSAKVEALEQENAMLRTMIRKHTREIEKLKTDIALLNESLNILTEVKDGTADKCAD